MNNDVTISFKNNFYEVPAAYIRQRIEIRPTVEDERELYLYDNEVRVVKIKFVDKKQNAKTFKPDCSQTNISFSKGKVTK